MDQVRVVWLWGFGAGLADMGPGRHEAGPTRADTWTMPATQSRKFKNKSNKMRILAISILKLR